jgi:hypothetical protein
MVYFDVRELLSEMKTADLGSNQGGTTTDPGRCESDSSRGSTR